MKKLNVLFISSWFPSSKFPFNGNFVIRHAEAVSKFCNVILLNITSDPLLDKSKLGISDQIELIEINISSKIQIPIFRKLTIWFNYYNILCATIKKLKNDNRKPDIIHTNITFPTSFWGLVMKIRFNIPYIITEHWTGFLPGTRIKQSLIKQLIAKYCCAKASCISPVSNDLRNAMQSLGYKGNYNVIPNAVNEQLFSKINKPKSIDSTTKFIHISSLLDDHKNITGILHAFKDALEKEPKIHLTIVSDNSPEDFLRFVENEKLTSKVSFEGPYSPLEIANALSNSDCFLLFSNYENLPCVIIESLMAGVPVISSQVGGISEMINSSNGYLIPKQNIEVLTNTIIEFSCSKSMFDQKKIQKESLLKYSYEAVGQKYLNVYLKSIKND